MPLLLLSLLALDPPTEDTTAPDAEAAAPMPPGQAAYATCGGCHGAQGEGNPALNAPALAGQDAAYTARQLKNYKAGVRGADPADTYGAQMRGLANVLPTDQAIDEVSAYIASLEPPAPKGSEADLSVGQAAFQNCVSCHGQKGEGNAAMNGPRLAGLDAAYLDRQLANYQSGARGAHPDDPWGASMVPLAKQLDADTGAALTAYIASL